MLRTTALALARPLRSQARRITTTPVRTLADSYEKHQDYAPEVVTRPDGRRTSYVKAGEEDSHYDVPAGPFTGSHFEVGAKTDEPERGPPSSTSASPAHPSTTRKAQDGTLAERNPGPSIEQGKQGLGAWANRK